MKPNQTIFASPQLQFFSQDQLNEIHFRTLEVLEKVGIEVDNTEALSLLTEAGAFVNGNKVKIPSYLIEEAIRTAPSRVDIANREGKRTLKLEKNQTHFGLGSDLPHTFDLETGERRVSQKQDVVNATRIAQNLKNIDFVMSMAIATDHNQLSYLHQFHGMVENTVKPIVFTARDGKDTKQIIRIAEIVAGGNKKLKENPFIACYAEPISPLSHSKDGICKLLICAENQVPLIYPPGLMAGATAPVTLAGAVVTANAEMLSGLLIHQLKSKGAPFIYGDGATILDMKTSLAPYGAPEAIMNSLVLTQLSQKYELPIFGTAGCSDSPVLDTQAAIEMMFSLLLSTLSGANLIHDVGYINNGLTQSLPAIIVANEAISLVKRFLDSYKVDDETVPLDVIEEVGPKGEFLSHEHTYKYFKEEFWSPELIIRQSYEKWEAEGNKTMEKRAEEKAKNILSDSNTVELEQNIKSEIMDFLKSIE